MRTGVLDSVATPVRNALAVYPKGPVLVPISMAATADDVRLIEVNRLVKQRAQVIAVL